MIRTQHVCSLVLAASLCTTATAYAQRGGVVVVPPAGGPGGVMVVGPRGRGRAVAVPPAAVAIQPPPPVTIAVPPPPRPGGAVYVNPGAGAPAMPPQYPGQYNPGQYPGPGPGRAVVVPPGSPPIPVLPPAPVIVGPMAQGRPYPGPARVTVAPPPMRMDAPLGPPPGAGYIWIPGYNHWNGNSSFWVPGHWEMPPQQGVVWIAPRWIQRGGYSDYYQGYWSTPQYVQSVTPNYGDQPLMIGSSMQGMLQYGDRVMPNGALANDFTVNLAPGQTVSIAVHGGPSWTTPGGNLDPMVQVLGNGGQFLFAQDDDSGGGTDSMVIFTPVRGGMYTIRVTSYGGGMNQGYYTLNTRFGVMLNGL